MSRELKILVLAVLFFLLHLELSPCFAGTRVFQIPRAPMNGQVNIYYTIDLPKEWSKKLKILDEARGVMDASPFLAAQGVTIREGEFALYFPEMRCLIVGAAASTQDELAFLFD